MTDLQLESPCGKVTSVFFCSALNSTEVQKCTVCLALNSTEVLLRTIFNLFLHKASLTLRDCITLCKNAQHVTKSGYLKVAILEYHKVFLMLCKCHKLMAPAATQ